MVDYGNPEREGNLIYDRQLGAMPQLGHQYGLANSLANQYGQQANQMAGRTISNEFSRSDQQMDTVDRQQQLDALDYQRRLGMGQVQGVAEQQYRNGLYDTANAQASAGASAVGNGSSLAAAHRAALFNNANTYLTGNNEAAMIHANEMNAARDRYTMGANALRNQDQSMWQALQNRELGQAGLNDQGVLASQGMSNQILGGQMQADQNAFAAQEATSNQRIEAEKQRKYGMATALTKGLVKAGVGFITAGASNGAIDAATDADQKQGGLSS